MQYGLTDTQITQIQAALAAQPEIDCAILYGSRALGTHKPASDIDLTLHGTGLSSAVLSRLDTVLDDLLLPYTFDISMYDLISNPDLRAHIERVGVVFWEREWVEATLWDVSEKVEYGFTASSTLNNTGTRFLRITDIASGRFEWASVPFCEVNEKSKHQYLLAAGDIVIARTGATTGENYTFKDRDPHNVVFASFLIRYRLKKQLALPVFVGFVLKSYEWKEYVAAIAGGSAQPGANAKELGGFPITLPPLTIQRAIAEVLSSLDDKIDLLHRQNKTLEELAQVLFRQWFVEEAREDWEVVGLSSIATFLNGLACQKFAPINFAEKLPVLKIRELTSGITTASDWARADVPQEYIVYNGDVIFAWSASLMVRIWDGEKCVLNQHLFKVTSSSNPKWFYYLWCKHHLVEFSAKAASHATTMGHIKRSDLNNAMVLIPPPVEMNRMTEVFEPIINKQIDNSKQIRTLTAMRDNLLPKLMSGEVLVKM